MKIAFFSVWPVTDDNPYPLWGDLIRGYNNWLSEVGDYQLVTDYDAFDEVSSSIIELPYRGKQPRYRYPMYANWKRMAHILDLLTQGYSQVIYLDLDYLLFDIPYGHTGLLQELTIQRRPFLANGLISVTQAGKDSLTRLMDSWRTQYFDTPSFRFGNTMSFLNKEDFMGPLPAGYLAGPIAYLKRLCEGKPKSFETYLFQHYELYPDPPPDILLRGVNMHGSQVLHGLTTEPEFARFIAKLYPILKEWT